MLREAILKKLSGRRKLQLIRLRDKTRFAIRTLIRARNVNSLVRSELPVIFVIGGNRSGTSLCTYIISRHPAVEVISEEVETPFSIRSDGHSSGYRESGHLWRSLIDPEYDATRGEEFLWGLPSSISKIYVDAASNSTKKRLIYELLDARATDLIPVLKMNQNSLRVPLLKELFPRARFVLITRDYKSYIESCKHKWTKNRELGLLGVDGHIDYPHIGLHWLMINAIALYDLKKHAKDDHIHIKLDELQGEESLRQRTINRVFRFLDLEPVEVNDEEVFDGTYTYVRSRSAEDIDTINGFLDDLINYENSLASPSERRDAER